MTDHQQHRPDCTCWTCMHRRRQRKPGGYGQDAAMALGVVLAILSAIVWAWTDSAAATCRNALVGALDASQCTGVTFWHDISGACGIAGILVIVFAGLAMYRGRQS